MSQYGEKILGSQKEFTRSAGKTEQHRCAFWYNTVKNVLITIKEHFKFVENKVLRTKKAS